MLAITKVEKICMPNDLKEGKQKMSQEQIISLCISMQTSDLFPWHFLYFFVL